MIYIFLPRVYIQNTGNGNAFREQTNTNTIKNEMEANMENGLYTAHEVAVILADAFGDDCSCNFNGIDEWLPLKCELLDACPNPCGVACWEQYLKYRNCKNEMESKEE